MIIEDDVSIVEKEFERQLDIVKKLIALGVKADHVVDDSTCLDWVKLIFNYKLIEPLVKAGTDPKRKSVEDGATVLDDIGSDIFLCRGYPKRLGYMESMYQILEQYS